MRPSVCSGVELKYSTSRVAHCPWKCNQVKFVLEEQWYEELNLCCMELNLQHAKLELAKANTVEQNKLMEQHISNRNEEQ